MVMTYKSMAYEVRPGTYFNYRRQRGTYNAILNTPFHTAGAENLSGFGATPWAGQPDVTALVVQDTNIAANTPYTFVFSSWFSTQAGILADLVANITPDIATNVGVTKSGLSEVIVTVTPTSTEPVSVWLERFQAIGLTDLASFWAGTPQTSSEITSLTTNPTTVTPVLVTSVENLPAEAGQVVGSIARGAGSAVGSLAGGLFSGLGMPMTLLLLGVGGIVLYSFAKPYMPRTTHENRYRRRRR